MIDRLVRFLTHTKANAGKPALRVCGTQVRKGMNCLEKDMGDCPCLIQLKLDFKCQTTIIFEIMKNGSLVM